MHSSKLSCFALCLAVAIGCGKKSDDSNQTQETAKPKQAPPTRTCDKGQVLEGDECVAVMTPEKIKAVGDQVSQLDALEKKLDAVKLLAAPIEVMQAVRKLDVWKTAVAASSRFKKVDELVDALQKGVTQLEALKAQLATSKTKLADLRGTLQEIYDGSGAAKTLDEARAAASGKLRDAIAPLEAQVLEAMKYLEPAMGELKKLKDILTGVCAMGALSSGNEELERICTTGSEAFGKALDFLENNKDAPKLFLSGLVDKLEVELGALVNDEAKKLIDKTQNSVNSLTGDGKKKPAQEL